MRKAIVAGALSCASLFAAGAHAGLFTTKVNLLALSEQDAAALRGKTVAVTFHERGEFKPSLPFAGVAPIKGSNEIADPAVLVRELVGNGLRDAHGAQLQPIDATATKENKPAKLAALHPEADYVLDIATQQWSITPYASKYMGLYLEFNVRAQLIETASQRVVLDYPCFISTVGRNDRPLRKYFEYDNARLAKDTFASLAWACTQFLTHNALRLPEGTVPATPEALVDPITVFMKPRPAPQANNGS